MKLLYLLIACTLLASPIQAQLHINEFMASNTHTLSDESGEYDDWIELYNNNSYSINLSGLYLTDDLENPTKWAFPDISIPGKGYLLIWADDDTVFDDLHANFKLSKDGEQLGVYDGSNFIDSLTFGDQRTDISFGLYPDGSANWGFFNNPTPGSANHSPAPKIAEVPTFSIPGGFYSGAIYVELSASSPKATIHYTLDCSDPTEQSLSYTEPILIDTTKVLRTKTFEPGSQPSDITTHTYIFNEDFNIAALSLVTNPPNLWDNNSGIYRNAREHGRTWERPASIEFFEGDGSLGFSANVGIRIHGGASRALKKKSFRYYFRSEYGQSKLEYDLFRSNNNDLKRFITLALFNDSPARCVFESGSLLRDALAHEIGRRMDETIALRTRPVGLFLNGEPWGLYLAIERVDEHFLETHFGIANGYIIENYSGVKEGSGQCWDEMIEFFESSKIWLPENYEQTESYVDLPNFTRYNIMEIYSSNCDWPQNNNIAYHGGNADDNWKWMLWDMDESFATLNANSIKNATQEDRKGTLILRQLLENKEYKHYFANQFADYLNSILLPENVIAIIDSLVAVIRDDIEFEVRRWGGSATEWEESIEYLKSFAKSRPDKIYQYFRSELGLDKRHHLTIEAPKSGRGKVRINSLQIACFPWSGIYFEDIPIELEALAAPGYRFKQWSDHSLPQTSVISIRLSDELSIYPLFEADTTSYQVVINEINYHSLDEFNPGDWIELYNYSNQAVNISGWHFVHSNAAHDFELPTNTMIEANSFLVLCSDTTDFHNLFPSVLNFTGNFDPDLSEKGGVIRFYNTNKNLVDSLIYDDDPPWPEEPDGGGSTLELIEPRLDHTLPLSWRASENHGTPGQPNFTKTAPMLSINPISLNFSAMEGGTDPEDQMIRITNTGSGTLSWTASEEPEQEWMNLSNKSGGSGIQVTVSVNTDDLIEGIYRAKIRITDPDASNSPVHIPVTLAIKPKELYIMRINAGGNDFMDSAGRHWSADQTYTTGGYGYIGDGGTYATIDSISGTDADSLYQTERWGLSAYCFDLPNGIYHVVLHFAEIYLTRLNKRLISVAIEGETVLENIDIYAKVGHDAALCYSYFDISVKDGRLDITFNSMREQPKISAIEVIDADQQGIPKNSTTLVEMALPETPIRFTLHQNYPNPFNSSTSIRYELPYAAKVTLQIFNVLGEAVQTLEADYKQAGVHSAVWTGQNKLGRRVTSGIYFYQLEIIPISSDKPGFRAAKKMFFAK